MKSPKDMTREAKAIVVATPLSSKLTILQDRRIRRADYAVSAVLRGAKVKRVAVEASCSHEMMPERESGYPGVKLYCQHNDLRLPGFDTLGEKPTSKAELVLFLDANGHVIDRTSYYDCDMTPWPSTTAELIKLVKQLAVTP
jgi:hypothetical protein